MRNANDNSSTVVPFHSPMNPAGKLTSVRTLPSTWVKRKTRHTKRKPTQFVARKKTGGDGTREKMSNV